MHYENTGDELKFHRHSIFIRNHNHLADNLALINRHWNEETLFQEARKINVAVYQKIIYEEWLPVFLGNKYCTRFGDANYDPDVDATTANDFSTAAFRSMHSFLNAEVELCDNETKVESANLSDTIMNTKMLDTQYDDILRGLLHQKMNLVGYSNEVLNKLFKNKKEIGLDLLSIDIQRGRDHGIPSYHKYRKFCNLKSNIKVFNDLHPTINLSAIIQLRQTYKVTDLLPYSSFYQITLFHCSQFTISIWRLAEFWRALLVRKTKPASYWKVSLDRHFSALLANNFIA